MKQRNRTGIKPTKSFTLAPKTNDRLDQLAAMWDLSRSGVIDQLVRQEAERQGIRVSEKVEAR